MHGKVVIEELGVNLLDRDAVANQQTNALVQLAELALEAEVDLALLRQLLAEDAQLAAAAEVVLLYAVCLRVCRVVVNGQLQHH